MSQDPRGAAGETPPIPRRLCNLERLIGTMHERDLDGIVSYLRPNVYYLSGFNPPSAQGVHETNGYAAAVISREEPEHPIVIVPDFDINYFYDVPTWIEDIRTYASLVLPMHMDVDEDGFDLTVPEHVRATEWGQRARTRYEESLNSACQKAMVDLGLDAGRVGFDNMRFGEILSADMPNVELADAYGAMKYVRQEKTPGEIELISKSVWVNQTAIERTVSSWERGMTWRQLNRAYNENVVELGGFVRDPGGFIAANPPGVDPTWFMQSGHEDFVVKPGTNIMFDGHGSRYLYCWDGGNTWIVDDEHAGRKKRISSGAANAAEAVRDAMQPGTRISELQRIGLEAFRKSNVPNENRCLIIFHGLGLEHIDIELSHSRADWMIHDRSVIATHIIHPGDEADRYFIEDVCVVADGDAESLYSWGYEPLTNH